MNKIRIIDLLNKIANFDYKTLPKKFKYNGYCYSWCRACEIYEAIDEEGKIFNLYDYIARDGTLNDEIEIIEEVEDKEYEDIEEISCDYIVPNTPATENEAYIMACFLAYEQIINALIRNQKKDNRAIKRL